MSKGTKTLSRFIGGIADSTREGIQDSYAFGRSIDVRTDPQNVTILPRTVKESGTVIQALPKWGEFISSCDRTYIYDEGGSIYLRTSGSAYSLLRTVGASHGNGMSWFGEDNFIYYTSDKLIGRYGPVCNANATFVDDFFGSQGGTPLNTNSLDLESSSTQYASRADTASLSVTGNLAIETWIKPESLPAAGNTMTLVSKWTEGGNARSYKFGIGTASNWFGDGSDGALTISSNTTEAPIDSACTGTSGTFSLSATNASFAAGQVILIHQTQGTGAGGWQRNKIQGYTAGTITLETALNMAYTTGAQVRVVKQHTDVTVNTGITYTAKAWNGTVGGILAFLANGTVTVTGTISAVGTGFRGGSQIVGSFLPGKQGEGYAASTYDTAGTTANSSGGGGSQESLGASGGGGGGGGHLFLAQGATGGGGGVTNGDSAGVYGGQDFTSQLLFGGGGGSGSPSYTSGTGGSGGIGGGIIWVGGPTVTVTGGITANGGGGGDATGHASGGGGGGGGGSVLLYGQVETIGTQLVTATGGMGGNNFGSFRIKGRNGGDGGVHVDYLTSYTGTSVSLTWSDSGVVGHEGEYASALSTRSILYATQDPNLGSSAGYTLFLSISSNGTNVETYTKPADILTGVWQHVAVSWDQSISTAELFLTGVSLGTKVGALTSISDNASVFNVGRDLDSSSVTQNLYDGLIDEVRVFAGTRQVDEIFGSLYQHINAATAGLVGYWQFNAVATDATANGNNLTLSGSPSYSTDVPFSAPTTRLDIDQDSSATGNTTALAATIAETSADKKSFTPSKDPQKSIRIYVAAKGAGSGTWTITVHDSLNNTIASKSVAKTSLPSSGDYEFVFDEVWRPLTNFTNSYHFHITDSDATGTVRSSSSNDMSTANFTTYFQFLVEDTSFHPVGKMLQFLVFGNERYVGTYEATLYDPNAIALPAGWRVRCFGFWQEYLAIGVIKGDALTDQDQGRIYFWDGIAGTYNFYIPVPEGGINSFESYKGDLYFYAGYQLDLMVYRGGATAEKVKRLPKITSDKYAEVYPGAMTMYKGLMRAGVAGASDSTEIQKGIYTYGHTNIRYPDVLTYDYPISSGNLTGTSVRIGMVLPVNQKLLIGWGDGTGYGVDYVDAANDCFPTATIEFLIDDMGNVWKEKLTNTLVGKFTALASGQSIDLRYKKDDDAAFTYLGPVSTVGETLARIVVPDSRENEVQYAVDLASTSGVSPTLKGMGIEADNSKTEARV